MENFRMVGPYPFGMDTSSGQPVHYLTFVLKYLLPVGLVHDYNMRKVIESKMNEEFSETMSDSRVNDVSKSVYTGSTAEGLAVPEYYLKSPTLHLASRDSDKMIEIRNRMSLDTGKPYSKSVSIFNIVKPDCARPSAFAKVKLDPDYLSMMGKQTTDDVYVNGTDIKQNILKTLDKCNQLSKMEYQLNGVAITAHPGNLNFREVDHVPAIPFPGWPEDLFGWAQRDRKSNWPEQQLIREVVSNGYHMVPKSRSENSKESDFEWRYSFSVAERTLARNFTKVQRKLYAVIKLIHSFYLKKYEVFPTYFVKTLYLWFLEEVPQNQFEEINIGCLILDFLKKIQHSLTEVYVEHYFIKYVNLLADKDKTKCSDLAKEVQRVHNNLIECLFLVGKQIQFAEMSGSFSIDNILFGVSRNYKIQPENEKIYLSAITDGLSEMLESYLTIMNGFMNFPDEFEYERNTKWNLFRELCLEVMKDWQKASPVGLTSSLHSYVYILTKFPRRADIIVRLLLDIAGRENITDACSVIEDVIRYCQEKKDEKRMSCLQKVLEVLNSKDIKMLSNKSNEEMYIERIRETIQQSSNHAG